MYLEFFCTIYGQNVFKNGRIPERVCVQFFASVIKHWLKFFVCVLLPFLAVRKV